MPTNAPGYPDFQAAPNILAKQLINTSIAIPNAIPLQIFKGSIPQYRHTFVGIGPTAGLFTLIVRPFDPFFSPLPLIEHRFVCAAGLTTMIIPNIFSGIELDVFGSSIGGGESTFWSMAFTNGYQDGYHWLNGPNIVAKPGLSVPALTTLNFPLPSVEPGPAQFNCDSNAAAGALFASLDILDTAGVKAGQIAQLDPVTNNSVATVILPPSPVNVSITNTTAGALICNLGLYPSGGL